MREITPSPEMVDDFAMRLMWATLPVEAQEHTRIIAKAALTLRLQVEALFGTEEGKA